MMDKNPATDATLPKYKAKEREIWTAEMLMQAIDACENKWLKVALHLAFSATVRMGELLGLPGTVWIYQMRLLQKTGHIST